MCFAVLLCFYVICISVAATAHDTLEYIGFIGSTGILELNEQIAALIGNFYFLFSKF